jgi:hypothetical protein
LESLHGYPRRKGMDMKIRLAIYTTLLVLGLIFWWSTSQAQGEPTCKQACEEQEQACLSACSEHSNPIECESDCRNDAYLCSKQCR